MPLNISQGDVKYDGAPSGVKRTNLSRFVSDYMVHNHYELDRGIYAAGLTSPDGFNGNKVGLVKLANDVLLLVCEWTAMSVGGPVTVPDPASGDSDWVLLDVMPTYTQVSAAASGSDPVYRASGAYVYAKKNPSASVFDDGVFPKAPWIKDGIFSRKIPLSSLDGTIIAAGKGANTGLDGDGFGPVDGKGFKGGGDLGIPKG